MLFHTYITVIIPAVVAFAATLIAVLFTMNYFPKAGIIAEDHNKEKIVKIPSSGGVAVMFGIVIGILTYAFGSTFVLSLLGKPVVDISSLLAVALSVVLITFVGFLDDINVRQERVMTTDRKDIREGLKQWQKPILTVVGALPLMAVNVGVSIVHVPIYGAVDLFWLYPLVVLPLAIIFVANAVNLLGGFDGLQTGMTGIAVLGMLIYAILYGNHTGVLLSAIVLASILAVVPFTKYRAKILPGDSYTYGVGAALVALMAIGNMEAFGIIIFIPWIIEFLLHLRRKFKVNDLGIRQPDGTLKAPYGKKIYSLAHWMMNIKPMKEYEVSMYLTLFELLFVVLAFALKFANAL